jgi:hypothetical protein
MRARVLAACLLAVVACDGARAATPPGAPSIGVARGAEHRAHPDADREWWRIRAFAPRRYGRAIIEVVRQNGGATLRADIYADDATGLSNAYEPLDTVRATARSLDATGPRVALHVRMRGRRIAGTLTLPDGARCRLTLAAARRGPAARGFRLGRHQSGDPGVRGRPVGLNWSMPAAHARTSARFVRAGRVLENGHGWFGSYEHGWGDIDLDDAEWQHWDEQVVHLRNATWVLFGLNRTDTMTGPGARDPMWLGVLARVTGSGVRACRARIRRLRWHYNPLDTSMTWPIVTRARCGRLRATFREGARLGIDMLDHKIATAQTRIGGRGFGWGWHAFH